MKTLFKSLLALVALSVSAIAADNPYTLSAVNQARIYVLPTTQAAATGYTHAFRLLHSDINGAGAQGDTVTVTLGSTPAKYLISKASVYVKTAFATSSGTPTITGQLGITGDTDALVEAVSVKAAGAKLGQVVLTDSSTGTASNTLAALSDLSTSDTYTDAAVNGKLAVIKNALASLAAKVNLLVPTTPVIAGTSATSLKLVLTFQNASGGEPDLLNAGELWVFVSMQNLENID